MIRSLTLAIGFLSFSCTILFSQSTNNQLPSAAVMPFTFQKGSRITLQDADRVTSMVEQYISQSGRFRLVDRRNGDLVAEELDRQKDGAYLDGYMVQQGKQVGAKYLIVGHVISKEEGIEYPTVQVGVVDVATGLREAVEVLSATGRNMAILEDANDLLSDNSGRNSYYEPEPTLFEKGIDLLKRRSLQKNMNDFLDDYFPQRFLITNIEATEDAVEGVELYGYEHKFKKGEKLRVIEIKRRKNPDGTIGTQKIEIARIKVDRVEGDYAQCTVKSKDEQKEFFEKKDASGLAVVK